MGQGYLDGCAGKQPYETWTSATKVAKVSRRSGKAVGVYKCRYCHKWHIGGGQRGFTPD